MRPPLQHLARFLRGTVSVMTVALAAWTLVACGSDGNITVGVVATQPIPDEPTLTPVPRATATPTNPVRPTDTPEPTEPSDCCSTHLTFGCEDPVCEACVCEVDDFCCGASED